MSWTPKKPAGAVPGGSRAPHAAPGEFGVDCPALAWHLSASEWPDKQPKRPARVTLTAFAGAWQGTLHLLGTGLMLRLELPGPEYLFEALEAALTLEVVPWSVDQWNPADELKPPKKRGS